MLLRRIGLIVGTLSLAASTSFGTASISKDQTLKVGNGVEPRELDPAKSTGIPEFNIINQIFEGLTSFDPVTMEIIPGVAESWTVSEDGKTYIFKIRKDSKWSDGSSLTAKDFEYSWKRALAPKTASEYAYQMYCIKGAKDYNTGKVKDANSVGIKVVDDYTLKVELDIPTAYFLQLTAFITYFPTPKKVIEKFGDDKWYKAKNIISNGPFSVSKWELNKSIKVAANKHYWDSKNVTLKEAEFLPIENPDTEDKSFAAGRIQMTTGVPLSKIDLYKKKKSKKSAHPFRIDPYLGSFFYRFNVSKAPFNDKRVRRAFSLAIDRTLIVERVLKAGQIPAETYTPDNTAGYYGPKTLNSKAANDSIKEAKKLLADAGFANGKGFPKVELLYNTSESHKKLAVAIQQMWKKNLNVNVGLLNQEWKVFLNSTTNLDFTLARGGWIGDYPDPNTFLDMFVTDGGQNKTGWSNKNYDKFISKAASELDNTKRFNYFKEAEKILLEELPIIPIYHYTKVFQISDKIKIKDKSGKIIDFTPNILGRLFFKNYAMAK